MRHPDDEDRVDDDFFPDPVAIPIENEIDLHSFSPRDIPIVVQEYCREAAERGFEEVRIMHGKGKGVQRRIVQSELARHPDVEAWWDAPPMRGGLGATFARLRTKPKE